MQLFMALALNRGPKSPTTRLPPGRNWAFQFGETGRNRDELLYILQRTITNGRSEATKQWNMPDKYAIRQNRVLLFQIKARILSGALRQT